MVDYYFANTKYSLLLSNSEIGCSVTDLILSEAVPNQFPKFELCDRFFRVIAGACRIITPERSFTLNKGEELYVPRTCVARVENALMHAAGRVQILTSGYAWERFLEAAGAPASGAPLRSDLEELAARFGIAVELVKPGEPQLPITKWIMPRCQSHETCI